MINNEVGRKASTVAGDQPAGRDSFKALADLARAALDAGDFAGALTQSDALIGAFPTKPQGAMLKARTLLAQRRLQEALSVLRDALRSHGENPKLLSLTRTVAFQHGGFEEAVEHALKLSEIAPLDRTNQAFLIQAHLASDDFVSAQVNADAMFEAFPSEPQAVKLKARVLLAQQSVEEVIRLLRGWLQVNEADPSVLRLARSVAFQHGTIHEAADYARKLLEIAPDDQKNQVFLVQSYLSLGDFASALAQAEQLTAAFPNEPDGPMLKAQARVAQHLVEEALQGLRSAMATLGADSKLLGLARNIAFQHGRFKEASFYGLRLSKIAPDDDKNKVLLVQSYMASGEFDAAHQYLRKVGSSTNSVIVKKAELHFERYQQLKDCSPAFVAAWEAALGNSEGERAKVAPGAGHSAIMIQYWSQGAPPDDVGLIVASWKKLLEREGLGQVELFDRSSAETWINDNAPEFAAHFSKAFHYAMESDIFRIAYASKRPSIYMDIDSWPMENTAEILRYGINNSRSLLYFRSHRPWLVNGFFISRPDCPFFVELAAQCLAIDLDALPRNHRTIETTFGPTRYNKVLLDLIEKRGAIEASPVAGVHGCSTLSFDEQEIDFTHEAAVASVKPPFPLRYKGTDDYWKGTSIAD